MPFSPRAVVRLLIVLGVVVCLLGVAAVTAAAIGDGGVALLVVGAIAILGGGFVTLVGQGGRVRLTAAEHARAERDLDARIAATEAATPAACAHEPSACGACGAACALAGR